MIKNRKKLLTAALAATSLLTTVSNADMLGAEVGFAGWASSINGDINKGIGSLDFESDLGYGQHKTNGFLWAYVDHPVPLIPNLKVQYTSLSDDADGIVDSNVVFNGETFSASDNVSSKLELNQLDIIPYYRILDNWVNLDLGINFKVIQGEINLETATAQTVQKLDGVVPMLYAKARFDLPFTGLSVEADGSYLGYDNSYIYDAKGGLVYETSYDFGATIGYRKESINIDDISNVDANLNIEGIYVGIFYHF